MLNIQYPVSSIQHPASSIQYPVSSIQYPASSIQHPASSIQYPVSSIHYPPKKLSHRNRSVIPHLSSFSLYRSCRKFVNYHIIVRGHNNGGAIIAADVKKKIHDLIRSFG